MIDHEARTKVISAIEDYLSDKIMAFDFDDELQDIETEDKTAEFAINTLWYCYDDVIDHKVNLSKEEWDFFQRLLLILKSDSEITCTKTYRWSWDHGLACVAVLAFVIFASLIGWNINLALLSIPFGIVSMLISLYRKKREKKAVPYEAAYPMNSYTQIRSLLRSVPGFKKQSYRTEIGSRTIRSNSNTIFNSVSLFFVWAVFSPFCLFFQSLPSIDSETIELATSK